MYSEGSGAGLGPQVQERPQPGVHTAPCAPGPHAEVVGAKLSAALVTEVKRTDFDLRAITDGMPSLLWALDLDGRFEFVNKRCALYLGISEEDCVGLDWAEVLHPADREDLLGNSQMSEATETPFVRDCRLRRHDGVYQWFVHRRSARRDRSGRITGWIGVSDDVSAQKESEVVLRQTETLTAMGRMASTLSHEINNPLSAVTNVLFLLERNTSLDHKAREYLETAQHQLARVTEATREQLQFQQHASETEQVDVTEVVKHLVRLSKPRLKSKRVALKRRYRGDTTVQCYDMELRQALRHVLHNALDAVPIGGCLLVRVQTGREWGADGRTGVRVTIADDGPGIPKAARSRLFEAFFTTKGMNGTGLGLWLSKGILDRHHGWIRIRTSTRDGRSGTAAVLFLPKE